MSGLLLFYPHYIYIYLIFVTSISSGISQLAMFDYWKLHPIKNVVLRYLEPGNHQLTHIQKNQDMWTYK